VVFRWKLRNIYLSPYFKGVKLLGSKIATDIVL